MLGVLVVVAAFALFIARLRRAERPRFDPVARANGVRVGRVVLARRGGPAGRTLGWSIVCGGREVFARLGDAPIELAAQGDGGARFVDRASGRVATVRAPACVPRWSSP